MLVLRAGSFDEHVEWLLVDRAGEVQVPGEVDVLVLGVGVGRIVPP